MDTQQSWQLKKKFRLSQYNTIFFFSFLSKGNCGVEKWLSSWECLLLLGRTQVQFPASKSGSSELLITPAPGRCEISNLQRHLQPSVHGHACRPVHIQNKQIFLKNRVENTTEKKILIKALEETWLLLIMFPPKPCVTNLNTAGCNIDSWTWYWGLPRTICRWMSLWAERRLAFWMD